MKIHTRTLPAVSLCFLVLCFAGIASAETRALGPAAEPLHYEFEDDDLLGDAFFSDGDLIRYRARPARTLLLRPRISFVGEMKKSIEHL